MPYLKSIPIHSTVNRSIAYILNPDKTDDMIYTTSLNCMCNAKDAYMNMKLVYEQFSGKSFDEPVPDKGKGRVKAIHYIQSFDPQDNISPELAHRIAKAFARKTFGDNCQIVIATHLDRGHLHNHFIINTYGIDGHKFNDNQSTLKHIREYSDRVCLAFGIQPINRKNNGRGIKYNEWEHKKRGTSWKEKIRLDIDRLIGSVKNLDELLYELELSGYTVRKGKYISVKAEGQQRAVRLKNLGADYTEASLISRIRWRDIGSAAALSDGHYPLRDDYIRTLNDVTELAKTGKKIQSRRNCSEPYSPQNDMDVYKISAQLSIINRDNIHSIGELEGKIASLKSDFDNVRRKLNALIVRLEKLENLTEQADNYFRLSDKKNLSPSEQLQLKICRQTLINNNINSRSDCDRLKAFHQETSEKIAVLKSNFENCKRLYDIYSDIAKTYYDISKGDYISNLISEKKREEEKHMKHYKSHGR